MSDDLAQAKILSISLIECVNLSIKYEYSGSVTSSGKSIPATILDAVSKISSELQSDEKFSLLSQNAKEDSVFKKSILELAR